MSHTQNPPRRLAPSAGSLSGKDPVLFPSSLLGYYILFAILCDAGAVVKQNLFDFSLFLPSAGEPALGRAIFLALVIRNR
jgi:hypothetical protein